jgi:hypothetical protein
MITAPVCEGTSGIRRLRPVLAPFFGRAETVEPGRRGSSINVDRKFSATVASSRKSILLPGSQNA